jgi:RNA polymerase sigma-70 factor, ECF subfamily
MHQLTDEELVARYQSESDSPRARGLINELFGRHHSRVAAWCYRMTGDRESAADLAQEIFLKAFRYLHSFRRDAKFTTWLYTVTRNHCTNELKSRATHPGEAGERELLELPDAAETADVAVERGESEERIRALLVEVLDETELKVMTLHYAEEMPLDAITRLLSLKNTSGAKAYIVSAKRKLSSAVTRGKYAGLRPALERGDE